jgi:hypothetical protein
MIMSLYVNAAFGFLLLLAAAMLYRIYRRRGPAPWREVLFYCAIGTLPLAVAVLVSGSLTVQGAVRVVPIVFLCVGFPFLAVQLSTADFARSRHFTVPRLMWVATGVMLLALFATPFIALLAACLAGFDCV